MRLYALIEEPGEYFPFFRDFIKVNCCGGITEIKLLYTCIYSRIIVTMGSSYENIYT